MVLFSAGRIAATEAINLPAAGLKANERGRLEVDAGFRTRVPHIFAVGVAASAGGWRDPPAAGAAGADREAVGPDSSPAISYAALSWGAWSCPGQKLHSAYRD